MVGGGGESPDPSRWTWCLLMPRARKRSFVGEVLAIVVGFCWTRTCNSSPVSVVKLSPSVEKQLNQNLYDTCRPVSIQLTSHPLPSLLAPFRSASSLPRCRPVACPPVGRPAASFCWCPQTFAGILWTATKAIEVGFVRRRVGDLLAACDLEVRRSRATLHQISLHEHHHHLGLSRYTVIFFQFSSSSVSLIARHVFAGRSIFHPTIPRFLSPPEIPRVGMLNGARRGILRPSVPDVEDTHQAR